MALVKHLLENYFYMNSPFIFILLCFSFLELGVEVRAQMEGLMQKTCKRKLVKKNHPHKSGLLVIFWNTMFSCSFLFRWNSQFSTGVSWRCLREIANPISPLSLLLITRILILYRATMSPVKNSSLLSHLLADWTKTKNKVLRFNASCAVRTCREVFPMALSSCQRDVNK